MKRRNFVLVSLAAGVAGCGRPSYRRATAEEVSRSFYSHDGPIELSLLSAVATLGNSSEHSALLINGSQRVIYDPAGTYDPAKEPSWYVHPRKYDIHYGVNDLALRQYIVSHARIGYFVEQLSRRITLEQADRAIELCEERGETNFSLCAVSCSWVLQRLDGFETVKTSLFPQKIREDFMNLSDVSRTRYYQQDSEKNIASGVRLEIIRG